MFPASNTVVGVDFGAPRRARDQRRKILAIAAHAVADRRYRVDAIGMNERLLVKDPPGWSAKELLDELLTRTVRIVAFDFPFSIPDALLRNEKFAANAGYTRGAFIGWRTFNAFVAERLPLGDPLDFRPFDACTAAGITVDVDSRLRALCCRYPSGGKTPDYDAADAFVALCTAILRAEGTCRMVIDGDAFVKGSKGTIWVRRIACRS